MGTMSRSGNPLRARGFSLIEVLVATVVLSVGLLGLAALQVSGLRVGQSSFYRAQAAQFASDMADRARANPGQAATCTLAITAPTPTSPSTACERDLASWRARLGTLPGGTGAVAVQQNAVNNMDALTVTVRWDDSRGGGTTTTDFVLVTTLRRP
jgi:type IV pilus assembly protein PilV